MYARLVRFTLSQANICPVEKLADQFASAQKTLKGFIRATFFGDDTVGEYGCLSLWDSKEDAEAAGTVLRPKMEQALNGIVEGPPTDRLFEVYEPQA